MTELIVVLAGAFLLDIALGDPVYRLHPVRVMGNWIAWLEKRLFAIGFSGFGGGGLLFAGALFCMAGVFGGALALRYIFPAAGSAVFLFLLYSCIGFMDLFYHALPIGAALEKKETEKARRLLQCIVGRDTSILSEKEITRATVESVAENFVDGFLATIFWFATGAFTGLALGFAPAPVAVLFALLHRTVNTLDAMVGYRTERYEHFGTVSARADDLLNFIPARLSIPLIALGAAICRLDARRCLATALRDRLCHVSPNAGHSESCLAGALGIRLGGTVRYPHKIVEKPWMGDALHPVTPSHIRQSCLLVFCAGWVAFLLTLFILIGLV